MPLISFASRRLQDPHEIREFRRITSTESSISLRLHVHVCANQTQTLITLWISLQRFDEKVTVRHFDVNFLLLPHFCLALIILLTFMYYPCPSSGSILDYFQVLI